MATLFLYRISDQVDMFLSDKNGDILLSEIRRLLLERKSPYDQDGFISGEGFTNINNYEYEGVHCIDCYCTTESSLGYFYQARLDKGNVITNRVQHSYFSKANIKITSSGNLIIKFDWTSEEKARPRVKEMIGQLGIELESFKITDSMLRYVQNHYHWTSAKIDKILKDGDKTKKVSYTIDPADINSRSLVDEEYRDYGNMCHLNFEIKFPYDERHPNTPSMINVKLYREGGHRIVINEEEFGNDKDQRAFQLYLTNELIRIKNESDGM
ncbi:hypothetical protein [Paenibacillus macerans]|uniref:hypothetical protein n=1 Tax=Paenibacillus macerans TaxID=44252 RepID=UPI0022E66F62|nr:hypothetical protein [Paenibacillus macerans]